MTWKGRSPEVHQLPDRDYPTGVKLTKREIEPWEARLNRKPRLEKYDITISPLNSGGMIFLSNRLTVQLSICVVLAKLINLMG